MSGVDVIADGDAFSGLRAPDGGPAPAVLSRHEAELAAPTVTIVAELTTNHFGDRDRLERMIRASHFAGADYVKLQKRDVESFYPPEQLASPYDSPFGTTFREYRDQLELTAEDFTFVDDLCGSLGIGWFASILDQPSFEFIQQFNPSMIKLPSTISEHTGFLTHVAKAFDGWLVISTGMTGPSYEDFILRTFVRADRLYLLQCNSAYPTPPEHCNVAVVRHYRDLSGEDPRIVPGYSSHDDGWLASALAVGAGALMIEKHVKEGSTNWAHFDAVAVDLCNGDFATYVRQVREAEAILGSGVKAPTPSEHHKYRLSSPGLA
jgi:N-acetylneuraminate synthase